MYTVYALHSPDHDKIYVDYSSDLESRLRSHNELGTKGWAPKFRPWEVVYTEEHSSKAEAMRREQQLKSGGGRRFIWGIIQNREEE